MYLTQALSGVGNGFEVLFCTVARRRSSCLLFSLAINLFAACATAATFLIRRWRCGARVVEEPGLKPDSQTGVNLVLGVGEGLGANGRF